MKQDSSPRRRVPAFEPVPVRFRKDGWTPARQADFLGRLCDTWCVTAAAHHVGMSRESAYRLRERRGAESFAAAWDKILAEPRRVRKSTHQLLWHRLFHNTPKPAVHPVEHVPPAPSSDLDGFRRLVRREMQRRRNLRRLDGRSQ